MDVKTPDSSDLQLVTVFRPQNQGELALAKSMLQAAEMEFAVRNENVQDLFGWGRFPAGVNLLMGPIEVQVRAADAEFAEDLLRALSDGVDVGEGS